MAEFLPPGKRRAVALQYLPEYFKLGYTPTRALESLRERGLGYKMQVFYRDWREMKEKMDLAELFRRHPPEAMIPRAWATTTEWKLKRRYQAVIEVEFWDIEKEEWVTRPWYVSFGRYVTKMEAEERLEQMILADPEKYKMIIERIELIGWERRIRRRM